MTARISRAIKNRIIEALAARGYRLQQIAPWNLRERTENPRDLLLEETSRLPRTLVVDVPLSRCRSEVGGAFTELHPFVATLARGVPSAYAGSALEAYYQHCRPASAVEVLGVSEQLAPGFVGLPANAYVMPWHEPDPMRILQMRASWMRAEGAQYGRQLDLSDGVSLYGPVSQAKGEMEIERLGQLFHSMRRHGFLRHDGAGGDIEGWLLTEAIGDWSFLVRAGQHRTAVAAALGYGSVPVRLRNPPIKREEVAYWPQVKAGRVTAEGALAVFDRILAGRLPEVAERHLSDLTESPRDIQPSTV